MALLDSELALIGTDGAKRENRFSLDSPLNGIRLCHSSFDRRLLLA